METKNCLDCGTIIRGRSDKKFCDDQCRSHFNNLQHADKATLQRPVNAILRRNHSILAKLCVTGTCRIEKDELLQKGFNINYHTHIKEYAGHNYHFCYDYGYRKQENGVYVITKKTYK